MTSDRAGQSRRNRAPLILLMVALLLGVYYAVILLNGSLKGSTDVEVDGAQPASGDYLTLRFNIDEVNPSDRTMAATLQPVAFGEYASDNPGELAKGVRIVVVSGGTTSQVVAYPGESIVDPTSLPIRLDRGDTAYPLDSTKANFGVSVVDESTREPVPFDVEIVSSARPWILTAGIDKIAGADADQSQHVITVEGGRDMLTVSLVAFYLLAMVITTLIGVVTIGVAILRRTLAFSNVIWLTATLIAFPTLRSSMPDAPPIGTSLDFLIFFPCMVIIAALLVWTGAYLLWRDSRQLRTFDLEDESKSEDDELDAIG